MVGYILSGSAIVIIGVSCEILNLDIRTGRPMAGGMSLPRVITNELLHCGQTHPEPTRGSPRSLYHRARGRASRYTLLYVVGQACIRVSIVKQYVA